MECRYELRAAVFVDTTAQPRDRFTRPEKRLSRKRAQRDDHLRLDDVDLPEEERLALFHFVGFGVAIFRRAALNDVGDVDILPLESDCLDDLRQFLPGAADERDSLNIFVPPRRLADKHQIRIRVTDAEHNLLPPQRAQLASDAVADVLANGGQLGDAIQADLKVG